MTKCPRCFSSLTTDDAVAWVDRDPAEVTVIKVVRAARADLGLKEAKALVDEAPKTLLEGANKEDAEKWKKELEAAGATVAIE